MLRQKIGGIIGKGTRDEMLRAFLWVSECQIAEETCSAWEGHLRVLSRELEDADRRKAATARSHWEPERRDEITQACHRVSSALVTELQRESDEAREAHAESAQVLFQLTSQLGRPSARKLPVTDATGTPLLETLVPLREQLAAAGIRLEELMHHHRAELHELAVQEEFRRQSSSSGSSVTLSDIDSMSPSRFVRLVERLLQRDGFETERPEGPGAITTVSAACPEGHSFLFSTHLVRGPQGWRPDPPADVGVPRLHAARTAAGSRERDLIVITNGGFSRPARRYAREHDLELISRPGLQRWAEWEEPVHCTEHGCDQDVA
ncbi:restriction endonuclease [Streptomyces sp. NPDC058286]|uniref:restriction endonuclease n=1 Tax=Streptomyces sp. NPDC058286 TaxID=3346422 RepID=UPI0036E449E1